MNDIYSTQVPNVVDFHRLKTPSLTAHPAGACGAFRRLFGLRKALSAVV